MSVNPPAWHVDHVSPVDDRKLRQIMNAVERRTGEVPTKSGTIRRAVRLLWIKEASGDEDQNG